MDVGTWELTRVLLVLPAVSSRTVVITRYIKTSSRNLFILRQLIQWLCSVAFSCVQSSPHCRVGCFLAYFHGKEGNALYQIVSYLKRGTPVCSLVLFSFAWTRSIPERPPQADHIIFGENLDQQHKFAYI